MNIFLKIKQLKFVYIEPSIKSNRQKPPFTLILASHVYAFIGKGKDRYIYIGSIQKQHLQPNTATRR